MRLLLTILLFLTLPCVIVHGQDSIGDDVFSEEDHLGEEIDTADIYPLRSPDSLETTRRYRQEELKSRKFDAEMWKRIVGDEDFQEGPPEEIKRRDAGEDEAESIPWSGPLLRTISYVVIILVVLAILYFLIRNTSFDVKIKRTKIEDDGLETPVENIETLDIQGLLDEAGRRGDFRLAVRLQYLGLLKKLDTLGVISWKKDKTNRDYLDEVFCGTTCLRKSGRSPYPMNPYGTVSVT